MAGGYIDGAYTPAQIRERDGDNSRADTSPVDREDVVCETPSPADDGLSVMECPECSQLVRCGRRNMHPVTCLHTHLGKRCLSPPWHFHDWTSLARAGVASRRILPPSIASTWGREQIVIIWW